MCAAVRAGGRRAGARPSGRRTTRAGSPYPAGRAPRRGSARARPPARSRRARTRRPRGRASSVPDSPTSPLRRLRGQSKRGRSRLAAVAARTSASRPRRARDQRGSGQDGHGLRPGADDPHDPAAEERPFARAAVTAARARRRVLRGQHGVEERRAVGRKTLIARAEAAAVAGDLGDEAGGRLHRRLGLAAANVLVPAPGGRTTGGGDVMREGPAWATSRELCRPGLWADGESARTAAPGEPGDRAAALGDPEHLTGERRDGRRRAARERERGGGGGERPEHGRGLCRLEPRRGTTLLRWLRDGMVGRALPAGGRARRLRRGGGRRGGGRGCRPGRRG